MDGGSGWEGTICCKNMCIVRLGADLNSPLVCELKPGGAVWVVEEVWSDSRRRLRISRPCAGWVTGKFITQAQAGTSNATNGYPSSSEPAVPVQASPIVPQISPAMGGLTPTGLSQPALTSAAAPPEKGGGFQQRISNNKKVKIVHLTNAEHVQYNGNNGSVFSFDPDTGRYKVRVVILSSNNVGQKAANHTFLQLKFENLDLHKDQVDKDKALNGDEIVLLGAGEAKKQLYAVKLDPQYWYDKAIERVFEAKNDFEVLDLPVQRIADMTILKRAYRKISLAVHPDKNQHPQAADAFRKVYGAFETLMDERQQRRLLWLMGKLDATEEDQFTLEEDEEDELFQWWWEASVSEIEKQVAELEGQQLDEFGAMWISDGLGGNVEDVKWIGLETAKRLHREDGAIFIDARDHTDYIAAHIAGAYSTPLPDIIDYGLVNIFQEAGADLIPNLLKHRKKPIIVYSEVATPFSRCRAFCRWLLRAGHVSIKVERVRRLRGGIFGWKHKNGPVSRPIQDGGRPEPLQEVVRALAVD